MRILLVVHQFLPRHVTGTEQYVRSVARGLIERGHDVVVCAYEPLIQLVAPERLWFEQDEEVDGIPVHRFAVHPELGQGPVLGDFENPLASSLFVRFLDQHAFDLVHVFHPRNLGLAALERPRERGIPVVVNLMDFWFLCPNFTLLRRSGELCDGPPDEGLGCVPCLDPTLGRILDASRLGPELKRFARLVPATARIGQRPLAKMHALLGRKARTFEALAHADAVLAPSHFLKHVFEAAGFPVGRIEPSPYGIDLERLKGFTKRLTPDRDLVLGYVGSLTQHKGLHVLLEAARSLRKTRLRVLVHGSDATHPEYSARVRRIAGRDPRIEFRGAFATLELGRVLGEIDVLVVPSLWYENTPFTMLEALAARIPVLASDLGGISEVVVHAKNGWLFRAGDAKALAHCIEQIAPTEARAGLEFAPPRTLLQNLDDFERVYARVCGAATQ